MPQRVQLVTQIGHSRLCGRLDATFLEDLRYAITVDAYGARILWHTPTGRVLRRESAQRERIAAPAVVLAPTGDAFVRIDLDGRLELTRTATAGAVVTFLEPPTPGAAATAAAFNLDGTQLLTAWSGTKRIVVWDVAERRVVKEVSVESDDVRHLAYSADGQHAAAASATRAWFWEADASEVEETVVLPELDEVVGIAVASGPARLVVSSGERIFTWDDDGRLRHTVDVDGAGVPSVSPQGDRIAVPSRDAVELLDAETGARIWTARDASQTVAERPDVEIVRFAPNGRAMITGHQDCTAAVWQTERPGPPVALEGHSSAVTSVAMSPGLPIRMVVGTERGSIRVSTIDGIVHTARMSTAPVEQIMFSANGARVLARSRDEVGVWDIGSWTPRFSSVWSATAATLSNDGAFVALAKGDRLEVWTVGDDEAHIATWTSSTAPITSIPYFDGERVVALLDSGEAKVSKLGAEGFVHIEDLGRGVPITGLKFSEDGRHRLFVGAPDAPMRWVDTKRGRSRAVGEPGVRRGRVALSGSGRAVAAVRDSGDGRVQLLRWTMTSSAPPQVVADLDPRYERVESLAFTFDERYLIGGLSDGTIRVWDVDPRQAMRVIGFDDGSWALVLDSGFFDGSNGGDVDGLHWVLDAPRGPVPVELEQLKHRFYTPQLLVRYHAMEEFSEGEALAGIESQPRVEITESPEADDPVIEIEVENDSGGIGPATIKLNGREVVVLRPPKDFDGDSWSTEYDLSNAPTLLAGPGTRPNVVEVFALNRAESIASPPAVVSFGRPDGSSRGVVITRGGAEDADVRPRLFAVVVGASDYAGDTLDLGFAAADATDFARALELGADRHFSSADVQLLVSDADARGTPATRDEIHAALAHVAERAEPADVFVLFLAGHGAIVRDAYFFITAEATGLPTDRAPARAAISTTDLLERIKKIAALQQAIILDTCHAGGGATDFARVLAPAQVKALQELKDRLSVYVLAGSTTRGLSYETPRLGHGVLTYALLNGMTGAAIPQGAPWNVDQIFLHALRAVPELSKKLTGVQRPEIARPLVTSSFDIGRHTPDVSSQLALPHPFPAFVRSTLIDDDLGMDRLGLMERVDTHLRERPSEIAFTDRHAAPGAYAIVGRYRNAATGLAIDLALYHQVDSEWTKVASTKLGVTAKSAAGVIVEWATTEAAKHRASPP